ncbi:MAG: hypothetical protein AAF670_14135, partial [Planctomycetota bacterium]
MTDPVNARDRMTSCQMRTPPMQRAPQGRGVRVHRGAPQGVPLREAVGVRRAAPRFERHAEVAPEERADDGAAAVPPP